MSVRKAVGEAVHRGGSPDRSNSGEGPCSVPDQTSTQRGPSGAVTSRRPPARHGSVRSARSVRSGTPAHPAARASSTSGRRETPRQVRFHPGDAQEARDEWPPRDARARRPVAELVEAAPARTSGGSRHGSEALQPRFRDGEDRPRKLARRRLRCFLEELGDQLRELCAEASPPSAWLIQYSSGS